MSDRHRRREASWDKKQEILSPGEIHSNVSWGNSPKWSKSEVNDSMMSGKFSLKHTREPLLEKRSGPMNDDFSKNRRRMETDPGFDRWEKDYSTHPSVDSYGPPYRAHDGRKGGNALMSRDRDRDPDRDRDRPRSPYRSRSRSRGRDWGSTKARSGSPFNDDRHETDEYVDTRTWSRTGSSRYGDYHRDDRNQFDKRQPNRTSKIPCRYFAAGNCNRDDCRFSHDSEPMRYDGRSRNDNSGNRNRSWHEQKPPDDLNRSDFGSNKLWDGPSWDDRSGKDIHDTKNRTWDEVDASGQIDVSKSNRNSDKKKVWDGPSWDDVTGSGFSNVLKPEDHKKSWNGVDESSLDDIHDHTSLDNNRIRNDIHENSRDVIHNRTPRDKNRIRDDAEPQGFDRRSHNDINDRTSHVKNVKKWDGPLWDEVGKSGHAEVEKSGWAHTDNEIRKWDGPELNEVGPEKNENVLPHWMGVGNKSNADIVSDDVIQQVSYEKDSIQSVNNLPKVELNEHVGDMNLHQQTQIQSKECVESLKPIDIDVPQVTCDANEANLTSQLAPQVNSLELSQIKVQVPELYKDLNITDAIDYLQSLASSAHNSTSLEVKTDIKTEKVGADVAKEVVGNLEVAENAKEEQCKNIKAEKVEEGDMGNDEKAMRVFKVALVEFVKEILKPKWKEGKLSREVHKNVVKKVVDKVTDAIQVNQIPKTQVKIDQYLAYSKPKITKLVEAYVERFLKANA